MSARGAGIAIGTRDAAVVAFGTLSIVLALLFTTSSAVADTSAAVAEYRIKAAFLFKFLGFVDWPPAVLEGAETPLVIGVMGAKTLSDELDQIASGRRINGHPVQVRVLGANDSWAGLQVLFVGRAESGRLAAIALATEGQPLLVVSESEAALALGSAINFVVVDDKVRFDISLRPVDKAGLKISARLLGVARTVVPNPS
jgi:hypothetical protein